MGKWQLGAPCGEGRYNVEEADTRLIVECYVERMDAEEFIDAHNADVAALEAEREALQAKLDNSLVPVPTGEECTIKKIDIAECFLFLGVIYRLHSFSENEYGAWEISDDSKHFFDPDTLVQPVRLVRVRDMEDRNDV